MKHLLILTLTVFLFTTAAQGLEKIPDNVIDMVDSFSKKKLDVKKDLAETKKMIEILLALDEEDPSRTEVMALSLSYRKNSKVYDKAFAEVSKNKTKEQKQDLKEIQGVMKNFNKNGNGY